MNVFDALILGIIEGFTEFLPISSTAHITLVSSLLGVPKTDFLSTFIIAIQLGAIIPVAFLYFKKYKYNTAVHSRVLTAFLPTALIGFVLYKVIKGFFLGNTSLMLWTLAIGGVILILFERYYSAHMSEGVNGSIETISHKKAFVIGCCQALAVVPGVSRSAATIIGGLALGINRVTIIEFTFLLAVPTMIAATGYDVLKNISLFNSSTFELMIVGFITSMIFAQISISFLFTYIKKFNFVPFGAYRIVAAIIFAFLLL